MKKIIVFQHIAIEDPGIFCQFMSADGIAWDTVELDEGEPIPDLSAYAALIVMGGPMDVWEEELHPWLAIEKRAIRQAVIDLKLPFLGFCLGHQLLAEALGGKVVKMPVPEVGVLDIELTDAGQKCRLFSGINKTIKSLQWHGAEVLEPPAHASVLARSPACAVQALQYGESAFSMQCHIEQLPTTVATWGKVPEYKAALEKTFGAGALARLDRQATQYMQDFNQSARLLYDNFMTFLDN